MQRTLLQAVAFRSADEMNTIISSVSFNVSIIYFVSSTDEGFVFVSQGM